MRELRGERKSDGTLRRGAVVNASRIVTIDEAAAPGRRCRTRSKKSKMRGSRAASEESAISAARRTISPSDRHYSDEHLPDVSRSLTPSK
ncbi:MAG TPA: hypothetical protein VFS34_02975 [Thermoanaerobaculia bacterium]|nr:hypothetical protein [Thermoanaerobaculia bacterium]